ncbi:hypothetical protein LCGC14_2624020 [marine sediment metagenome]|uniref:Uncharacterized protein n=1 Tax=marine sediment metagenome TaxID=412755 RepID=A0A0F9CUP9_9ZZZZ
MKCIAKTEIQYRPHPIECIKQDCVMWAGSACAISFYGLDTMEDEEEGVNDI